MPRQGGREEEEEVEERGRKNLKDVMPAALSGGELLLARVVWEDGGRARKF